MRLSPLVLPVALVAFGGLTQEARADEAVEPAGVAVVAEGESADVTWPFAQATYVKEALRPKGLSEPEARALAGEVPAADAPPAVKELAELRHAVQGDDTVSREVLGNVGLRTHTKSLLVVSLTAAGSPEVRMFDVAHKSFDAARWQPTAKEGGGWTWDGVVSSVERSFAPVPAAVPVAKKPALVVVPGNGGAPAKDKGGSKMFWESPWFWVALGSAALIGGGMFLITHDWSGDTVPVRMQVPR